jgi:hypothetical protein
MLVVLGDDVFPDKLQTRNAFVHASIHQRSRLIPIRKCAPEAHGQTAAIVEPTVAAHSNRSSLDPQTNPVQDACISHHRYSWARFRGYFPPYPRTAAWRSARDQPAMKAVQTR